MHYNADGNDDDYNNEKNNGISSKPLGFSRFLPFPSKRQNLCYKSSTTLRKRDPKSLQSHHSGKTFDCLVEFEQPAGSRLLFA